MALALGDTTVSKLYLGDDEVEKMYLGDALAFEAGPAEITQTFAVGAGTVQSLFGVETADLIEWDIEPNLLIDSAFNSGDTNIYLAFARLINTFGTVAVSIRAGTSTSGTGNNAGEDLIESWETYDSAVTIAAAGIEIVIPGPRATGNTGSDSNEPYQWGPSATKQTEIAAFINSYAGLTADQRASTTLTLSAPSS